MSTQFMNMFVLASSWGRDRVTCLHVYQQKREGNPSGMSQKADEHEHM